MAVLKVAPVGAQVLDLVANRAARAEARAAAGEGLPVVHLDAGYVEVKAEVDLLSAEDFSKGEYRAGLAKLLADPADIDVLIAEGLSAADIEALTEFVTGDTLGESSASSKPSLSLGDHLRPTSPGSTARTSAKRATAKKRGA